MLTYKTHTASILYLITLMLVPSLGAQDRVKGGLARDGKQAAAKTLKTDEHEKLIRSVYEKLAVFSAAAETQQSELAGRPIEPARILKFDLRNFHSGSIQAIIDKPYREFISLPTGEVLMIGRSRHSLNNGPEEVVFEASWQKGQYASLADPDWTFRDVLQAMAEKYFDIGSYTSYEVTVSLDGKTRSYRAMTVFHDLLASPDNRPEFWDLIVPNLHQIWSETLPPYKPKSNAAPKDSDQGSPEVARVSIDSQSRPDRNSGMQPVAPTLAMEPVNYFWLDNGFEGHASGSHIATANFNSACSSASLTTQRCDVLISNFVGHDSGTLDSYTRYHQGATDKKTEGAVGPKGTTITCQSAAGVTFSSCIYLLSCDITATVGISSGIVVSATISGGNLRWGWLQRSERNRNGFSENPSAQPNRSQLLRCGRAF